VAQPTREQKKRQKLLDIDTAEAILAEPFDAELEADREIELCYIQNADGTKSPMPGVISAFLTATTMDILGCSGLGSNKSPPLLFCSVSKDAILADIQFRGAISDLHAFRQAIIESDCDTLVFHMNETDMFGDGNNVEVAVAKSAADRWTAIDSELERRHIRDERIELRKLAKRSLPASKREIQVPQTRHLLRGLCPRAGDALFEMPRQYWMRSERLHRFSLSIG
jgi:hypothetical protein